MKVAIIHDILIEYGGSETVFEKMIATYPNADIFTFLYNKKDLVLSGKFSKKNIRHSIFNFLLAFINKKFISLFKPLALLYFYFLNLEKYDLVISSSHSYGSKIIRKNNKYKHISYIHTIPKHLYSDFNEISFIKYQPFKSIFFPFLFILRKIDYFAAQQPNLLLTNSKNIQQKILEKYNRESKILYPPIKEFAFLSDESNETKKFYISHSRLVKQKGFDLIVDTFNENKKPLIIIGDGYLLQKLKKKAKRNILFTGWLDKNAVAILYKKAKALVYAAIDEDFGLVPVEAMSLGLPVIAYYSGGTKETILNKESGLFYYDYSIQSLNNAVQEFERSKILTSKIRKQAKKFTNNFEKKLKGYCEL